MKSSVWSGYFGDLSPEAMVDMFVRHGWYFSELSNEHGEMLLQRGNPEKTGREYGRYAEEKGLSIPQGHLWLSCDITGSDKLNVIEHLKKWLDLYAAIGIKNAVLHPGTSQRYFDGDDQAAIEDDCVDSLRRICEYCQDMDITICLENLYNHARSCSDLLRLISHVGYDMLGICLDTGHLNMSSGDQGDFIREAGNKLKALHIADNEGETDQHIMPFGRGNIDWLVVISALRQSKYRGLFNYEIPGECNAPLGIRLAKLEYLKKMTEWLMSGEM